MVAYKLSSSSIFGRGMENHVSVVRRLAICTLLVNDMKCDTTFEHLMSFLRVSDLSIMVALLPF